MSRLIKYPIEIRKEGYEFLPINQGGEDRLKQWTGKNTVITQTFKNKKELILLPRNAHPDAPMIKQNYEQDTWISFYRLAETTGLAINKPLPDAEIQEQIIPMMQGCENAKILQFYVTGAPSLLITGFSM